MAAASCPVIAPSDSSPIGPSSASSSPIGPSSASSSLIGPWFNGRSVLITGSTGFLGGVLVEKLLRGSPLIDKLYLLIRVKPGEDVNARVAKLVDTPLFAGHSPEALCKLVGIPGDISAPRLAISQSDRARLLADVSVVFHSAASINFNAALESAVATNLLGTKRVLELCHHMKALKALVYVSTAYCNCTLDDVIEERVFPSHYTPDHVIKLTESLTSEELRAQSPGLIGNHPNTYSFTKLLSENLLNNDRGDIPVAIVRPTIVLSTVAEPVPGWVDNVSTGAFAFIAGASRGIFRCLMADRAKVVDFVPCDHVTNLMIAAAWSAAQQRAPSMQVYHYSSGEVNPLTWGEYVALVVDLIRKHPCGILFWYPGAKLRNQQWRNDLATWLLHIVPAHVAETLCRMIGRKMILSLLSIQKKYSRGQKKLSFFTHRQWRFNTSATQRLADELTTTDRKLYDFNMAAVDWPKFIESNVFGLRHYFHKESPDTLAQSRKNLKWWLMLNIGAYFCLLFVVAIFTHFVTGDVIMSYVIGGLVTLFMVWL